MSRTNKKRSTKKKKKQAPAQFGRTLTWTIVLSLVFSAGLIVGQRMLKKRSTPALVSVTTSNLDERAAKEGDAPAKERKEKSKDDVSFSFYERLGATRPPALDKLAASDASGKEGALPARYTLQVGSYPSLKQAQSKVRDLKKEGVEAFLVASDVPDKGKVYRVRLGKFHSMDEARQFQAEIKRQREIEVFVMPL